MQQDVIIADTHGVCDLCQWMACDQQRGELFSVDCVGIYPGQDSIVEPVQWGLPEHGFIDAVGLEIRSCLLKEKFSEFAGKLL
ncbi:hypothetical protein DF19_08365 [Streptomyces olindensis]|nr:hypothetical protein DF19_08365 [Streptomyces olindensis]